MTKRKIDGRRFSPSAARNRDAILEILRRVLPPKGVILEVGSGTGEHAVYFAPHFKKSRWQTSDADSDARASISAWIESAGARNVLAPIDVDAREPVWPVEQDGPVAGVAAIVSINMIHIAPWASCLGLLDGAERLLAQDGVLFLYGPFKIGGVHTASSNAAFDQSLRSQDPEWGVRDLDEVAAAAAARGLTLVERVPMPANNFSVVFRRD